MSLDEFLLLVKDLCSQQKESEWIEFKHNNEDPEKIGEYISALSNSAALHGKSRGYMIWGNAKKNSKYVPFWA